MWTYDRSSLDIKHQPEHAVEGARSRVDFDLKVGGVLATLCEGISPPVMKKFIELLPPRGIKLEWVCRQSVIPEIPSKVSVPLFPVYSFKRSPQAALYMARGPLSIRCHNYWIVCRLVKHDENPYIVYSQETSVETYLSCFWLSFPPFYLLSRVFLSILAHIVQIWNLIRSRGKNKMRVPNLKTTLTMIREHISIGQVEWRPLSSHS